MTLPDLDARHGTMLLFPLVLPLLCQALVRVPAAAWVRVMLFVRCSCLLEAAGACMCAQGRCCAPPAAGEAHHYSSANRKPIRAVTPLSRHLVSAYLL
jgi:hypothetical protein